MSKLIRKFQKLFAGNAPSSEIGKFGSFAAGSPATSNDPDQIQSLSQFTDGWFSAVLGNGNPCKEDQNALDFLAFRQLAYLFQAGVAEYDSSTTYYIGSIVNVNGILYKSLTNANTGNDPTTDAVNWVVATSSGTGLETLLQKLENEKQGIFTESLENSLGLSGAITPNQKSLILKFIQQITATNTSVVAVLNPVPFEDADPNTDSTANWSLEGGTQSANLMNGGAYKIGTDSIQFDKTAGGSTAGIILTLASASKNLASNTRARFWAELSTATNFTKWQLRIAGQSNADYAEWDITTKEGGAAFAAGDNLCFVDLNTTPTTTGGAGWTPDTPARYAYLRAVGTAGSTFTFRIDALCFGDSDTLKAGLIGRRVTLHDDTNSEKITISASNTQVDGFITISAAANTMVGGLDGATIAYGKRSVLSIENNMTFFDEALSGAASLSQSVRLSRLFPDSLSGSLALVLDVNTPQFYEATAVVTNTSVDLFDPSNDSANLVNNDVLLAFQPQYDAGEIYYKVRAAITITGSSHASNTTTVTTAATGGLQVGDMVIKIHATAMKSGVSNTAAESFSALTIDLTDSGSKLFDIGLPYPSRTQVVLHTTLGGRSLAAATTNRQGVGPNLTVVGAPSFGGDFKNGQKSAFGFTPGLADYYYIPYSVTTASFISGDAGSGNPLLAYGIWFFIPSTISADSWLTGTTVGGTGHGLYWDNAGSRIQLFVNGAVVANSPTITPGSFIHCLAVHNEPNHTLYINGVEITGSTSALTDSSAGFIIGGSGTNGSTNTSIRYADLVLWSGYFPSVKDERAMYANGKHKILGKAPMLRHTISVTGTSGKLISAEASLSRTTTGVQPFFEKIGMMKV